MVTLFLDDDEARLSRFARENPASILVKTADEAVRYLQAGAWDEVWLDHDLGGKVFQDSAERNTGAAVVRWVVENRPSVRRFLVHSLNSYAADGMVNDLRKAGYRADRTNWVLRSV